MLLIYPCGTICWYSCFVYRQYHALLNASSIYQYRYWPCEFKLLLPIFAAIPMIKIKSPYSYFQKTSAVFMMLALVWLTISTPLVCAFKQEMAKQAKMENTQSALMVEEDSSNSLGSNTKEKTPSGPTSFSEDYLHHAESTHFFLSQSALLYKCTNSDTYTAFHGELLVPPPNPA